MVPVVVLPQWKKNKTKEDYNVSRGIKRSETRGVPGSFVYSLARASLEPPCLATFNSHNTL